MSARPGILITGGAKRIGEALVRHFARQGYDIALHYNRSAREAKKLAAELEKLGAKCHLFSHDLQESEGIPKLMQQVKKSLPNCTALINNASVFERAELMDTDEALFDRQFAVNFKAPFFLTQAFAKTMKKGCVINMLDTDIVETRGSHFAYLLSKKTLAEFTVMAARSLGPGIRVNGICPGCMLPSDQNEKQYEQKMKGVVPLKSNPGLEELAEAASWLVGQKHITGQLIFVDGGKHVL